jgi:prevent-host-death family protein
MRHVNLADAKAHLSKLIAEAENGETIEITKRGKVVAKIVPVGSKPKKPIDIEALRRFRATLTSPVQSTEESIREWKDYEKF